MAWRRGGWLVAALVLLAACAPPAASRPAPAAPAAADSAPAVAPAAPGGRYERPADCADDPGAHKGTPFVHLYAAQALGIFRRHGLDARLVVMSPPTAAAGLQSGEVDLMAAIGSSTRAALRGVPCASCTWRRISPTISSWAPRVTAASSSCRGQVVTAYAPANTINALIVELMSRHGLGPNDYQLLNAGDGPPAPRRS